MQQVKVFDGNGYLKHIISPEEVKIISNIKFENGFGTPGGKRKLKSKFYNCDECRKSFKSNSTKGAKYCPVCRKGAYKRSRKKGENND